MLARMFKNWNLPTSLAATGVCTPITENVLVVFVNWTLRLCDPQFCFSLRNCKQRIKGVPAHQWSLQ